VDEAGVTVMLPEAPTVPTLGLKVTEVAPLTFHVKFDVWPLVITGGLAIKLVITGVPEAPGTRVQLHKAGNNMMDNRTANLFIQIPPRYRLVDFPAVRSRIPTTGIVAAATFHRHKIAGEKVKYLLLYGVCCC
jgi:hypothetical protein